MTEKSKPAYAPDVEHIQQHIDQTYSFGSMHCHDPNSTVGVLAVGFTQLLLYARKRDMGTMLRDALKIAFASLAMAEERERTKPPAKAKPKPIVLSSKGGEA